MQARMSTILYEVQQNFWSSAPHRILPDTHITHELVFYSLIWQKSSNPADIQSWPFLNLDGRQPRLLGVLHFVARKLRLACFSSGSCCQTSSEKEGHGDVCHAAWTRKLLIWLAWAVISHRLPPWAVPVLAVTPRWGGGVPNVNLHGCLAATDHHCHLPCGQLCSLSSWLWSADHGGGEGQTRVAPILLTAGAVVTRDALATSGSVYTCNDKQQGQCECRSALIEVKRRLFPSNGEQENSPSGAHLADWPSLLKPV